jgi:1-aminocyclopropane-1-carboxylate deaminase/D-cysteine desulfhydrase-like pyridoxal-dependent ACC family enzyme
VELVAQLGERPSCIVLPVGSGGSCAGLLAGLADTDLDVPVVGVSVSRPPAAARATVLATAMQCAELRGGPPPRAGQLELVDAVGAGFGVASAREDELALLALHTEGLLLDATYGAKAFAVAVDRLRSGPVLWWHTGGVVPAVAHLTKETRP